MGKERLERRKIKIGFVLCQQETISSLKIRLIFSP